jgi:hypothetical protein
MFTNNETTDSIHSAYVDADTIHICFMGKSNRKFTFHGSKRNLWVIPNEARIDLYVTLFACADRIKMLSSTFDMKIILIQITGTPSLFIITLYKNTNWYENKKDKELLCPNHKVLVYYLGSGAYAVGCCAWHGIWGNLATFGIKIVIHLVSQINIE